MLRPCARLRANLPHPLKRAALLATIPLLLAACSWPVLYMALYAAHSALAHPAQHLVTVNMKGMREQPWTACRHALFLDELRFYPGGRFCVSRDVYHRVRVGDLLRAEGSASPVGQSITRLVGFAARQELR